MRSDKEIGDYLDFGERVNLAYKTYASLYLDFVDDNVDKFFKRMKDVAPLDKIENDGSDLTEDNCFKAYFDAAVDIAKIAASSGYFSSFEEMYQEYPLLKEAASLLENKFYENER